eukprot:6214012-Alexandrium_andersonii.AAC.1
MPPREGTSCAPHPPSSRAPAEHRGARTFAACERRAQAPPHLAVAACGCANASRTETRCARARWLWAA